MASKILTLVSHKVKDDFEEEHLNIIHEEFKKGLSLSWDQLKKLSTKEKIEYMDWIKEEARTSENYTIDAKVRFKFMEKSLRELFAGRTSKDLFAELNEAD